MIIDQNTFNEMFDFKTKIKCLTRPLSPMNPKSRKLIETTRFSVISENDSRIFVRNNETFECFFFRKLEDTNMYHLVLQGMAPGWHDENSLFRQAWKQIYGTPITETHFLPTKEEENWKNVEQVHNQLASILKKGTDGLEANDLAVVFLGLDGNKAFVPTTEQLIVIHDQINTLMSHRFKTTHPNGMDEDCYICTFLKNEHKNFMGKFGWKGNKLRPCDIHIPKRLLLD